MKECVISTRLSLGLAQHARQGRWETAAQPGVKMPLERKKQFQEQLGLQQKRTRKKPSLPMRHAQVISHHPAASLENKSSLSLNATGKVIKGFRFDTFEQSSAQYSV